MSTSTLTYRGRLPGVDCSPALPPDPTVIRLDVAGFVGFAERGPLDLPVAVEDINQYQAVFGGDIVLATDNGVPVYANLPGTVAAFFNNGGRRCYVVRVAGAEAQAARWVVPGLRLWRHDGVVEDVYVDAAWPGRWSAGYGPGTQLLSEPLATIGDYRRATAPQPGQLVLGRGSLLLVSPGDLLSVDLGPLYPNLYLTVATVDRVSGAVGIDREVAFLNGPGSPPEPGEQLLLGPDAVAALPATIAVRAAYRLQLDLVARDVIAGSAEVVERWTALAFNPGPGTSWLDVVQPADDETPDQSRSMILRADAESVLGLSDGLFLPVGMDQLGSAAEFTDAEIGSSVDPGVRVGDDGLAVFAPAALFLDPQLRFDTVDSLLTDADQLTVLSANPVRLRGIHALTGVDEVALLSAPDAVHRTWSPAGPPPPLPVTVVPVTPPPDWSDFRDCVVVAPTAVATEPPDLVTTTDGAGAYGPPVLDPAAGYDVSALLDVHRAMVVLGAARADLFAVLGVPRHFDTTAILAWRQQLADSAQESQAGRLVNSPLSFAGYWHPWVRIPEPTTPGLAPLRDQPADGVACGLIAARELARGVWVAPANVGLRGPVGLTPTLSAIDTTRLFDAHANLLRRQPGAVTSMSAHTLSADPMLLQVSVRRLVILLRKVALVEGNRYVFNPNTDRFRQLVRMRFERLLAGMARRGAVAAYQVVTDSGVNTADDLDNGRLIVSIQIAPTSPIEFITVTLIRSGEDLLDVVVS